MSGSGGVSEESEPLASAIDQTPTASTSDGLAGRPATESPPPAKTEQGVSSPSTAPSGTATSVNVFKSTFSSLSNRHFLFLWLGMLSLMAGTQMQMLTRGYLAYELTGSGTILGIVNLGIAVPLLTIPLFGGAFADRFERKALIQGGQFVAGALGLAVGILVHTGIIAWPHLMISAMIQGSLFAFSMPARQAIIPHLVGPEKLANAMALNAAGMSAMTMAAPALAGWLYAYAGPWNVYYVISALGFLSMALTAFVPTSSNPPRAVKTSVTRDILEGILYLKTNRLLMVLLVMGLITTLLAMPFRFIMPIFVVDIYQRGPESMGLLVGVMGLGALVGSLYIAGMGRKNRGMLLILSSFVSGIGLLLVAVIPIYAVAAFLMLLLGLGDAGRMSLNQTLIMEKTEDRYRGRVMSIFMLNFGLMPLGVLPAGILADYLGGQAVVGTLGLLLIGVTALVLVTQKQLRRVQ